jgi:hypothetical protein
MSLPVPTLAVMKIWYEPQSSPSATVADIVAVGAHRSLTGAMSPIALDSFHAG